MFVVLGLLVFPERPARRRWSPGSSSRCCSPSSSARSQCGSRPRSAPSTTGSARFLGWAGLRGAVPIVLGTFVLSEARPQGRDDLQRRVLRRRSSPRSCRGRRSSASRARSGLIEPPGDPGARRSRSTSEPTRSRRVRRLERLRDRGRRRARARPPPERTRRPDRARQADDPAARKHGRPGGRPASTCSPRTPTGRRSPTSSTLAAACLLRDDGSWSSSAARQVPRQPLGGGGCGRDAPGLSSGRARRPGAPACGRRRGHARRDPGLGPPGTLPAVRVTGPDGLPSTLTGPCSATAPPSSRWRVRAASRSSRAQRSAGRHHVRHRRADRRRSRQRLQQGDRRRRRLGDGRRRARCSRRARLVAPRRRRRRRLRRTDDLPRRAAPSSARRRAPRRTRGRARGAAANAGGPARGRVRRRCPGPGRGPARPVGSRAGSRRPGHGSCRASTSWRKRWASRRALKESTAVDHGRGQGGLDDARRQGRRARARGGARTSPPGRGRRRRDRPGVELDVPSRALLDLGTDPFGEAAALVEQATAALVGEARPVLSATQFRSLFLLDPDVVFLNHGSFGAVPRPVFEEQERLRRELEAEPVLFLARSLEERLAAVREAVGALVHANPDDLGLVPNTTTALNVVALSLDLGPGDEVVTTTHEYGAMAILWDEVSRLTGATVRPATLPSRSAAPTRSGSRRGDADGADARPLLQPHHVARRHRAPDRAALRRGSRQRNRLRGRRRPCPGTARARPRRDRRRRLRREPPQVGLESARLAFVHVRPELQERIRGPVVSWNWTWEGPDAFRGRFGWPGTVDPTSYLAVPTALGFQREHAWPDVVAACRVRLERTIAALVTELDGMPAAAPDLRAPQFASVHLDLGGREPAAVQRALWDGYRIEVPSSGSGASRSCAPRSRPARRTTTAGRSSTRSARSSAGQAEAVRPQAASPERRLRYSTDSVGSGASTCVRRGARPGTARATTIPSARIPTLTRNEIV